MTILPAYAYQFFPSLTMLSACLIFCIHQNTTSSMSSSRFLLIRSAPNSVVWILSRFFNKSLLSFNVDTSQKHCHVDGQMNDTVFYHFDHEKAGYSRLSFYAPLQYSTIPIMLFLSEKSAFLPYDSKNALVSSSALAPSFFIFLAVIIFMMAIIILCNRFSFL